jgi:pyruvate dehydrogenase E2 component (dihydrolipoamide acetyltransferase)/2-oxoglutarate dehydrogenase E2 component (dihydrolipoamide succinyltransferase)
MAVQILMPKLGMSTAPLTLVEWKAKEGEPVEKGNIVLVVETEKIRHDIEAEVSGFLHILVKEGQEVPIATVVGLIAATKEELEALKKERPKEAGTAAEVKEVPPAEAAQVEAAPPPVAEAKAKERILISPVARKLAEEHTIDITTITGTGPGGRIVREDIEKAVEAKKKVGVEKKVEAAPEVYQGRRVKSTIPLKGMRKVIAEHMHRSLSISAQLTVMGEIDMTEMVKLRQSLVSQEEALGTRITYTDLFVFVAAKLLREYPIVNASLIDNEIKVWESINIGVATALEEGLIVPVVKDADKKSLVEISKTVRSLVQKAREGKLMPDEATGGTFTITNLGALGGGYRFETVIINQPEAAILGTGGITDRAVVRDGQIVIRPIMTYYFTYDHRVFTGAVAAKFMASATQLMENPGPLLG